MKDNLQEIINELEFDNTKLQERVKALRSKSDFCNEHKFSEEERICRIQLIEIDMVCFSQTETLKKLKELQAEFEAI